MPWCGRFILKGFFGEHLTVRRGCINCYFDVIWTQYRMFRCSFPDSVIDTFLFVCHSVRVSWLLCYFCYEPTAQSVTSNTAPFVGRLGIHSCVKQPKVCSNMRLDTFNWWRTWPFGTWILRIWCLKFSFHATANVVVWEAICSRCRREASCHFLQTLHTGFFNSGIQCLVPRSDRCLNVNVDHVSGYVEVWCLRAATNAPCVDRGQNKVLGITSECVLPYIWNPCVFDIHRYKSEVRPFSNWLAQCQTRAFRLIIALFNYVMWSAGNKMNVKMVWTFHVTLLWFI
jgi:hypothetical protein